MSTIKAASRLRCIVSPCLRKLQLAKVHSFQLGSLHSSVSCLSRRRFSSRMAMHPIIPIMVPTENPDIPSANILSRLSIFSFLNEEGANKERREQEMEKRDKRDAEVKKRRETNERNDQTIVTDHGTGYGGDAAKPAAKDDDSVDGDVGSGADVTGNITDYGGDYSG